jgi:hypothetical protein
MIAEQVEKFGEGFHFARTIRPAQRSQRRARNSVVIAVIALLHLGAVLLFTKYLNAPPRARKMALELTISLYHPPSPAPLVRRERTPKLVRKQYPFPYVYTPPFNMPSIESKGSLSLPGLNGDHVECIDNFEHLTTEERARCREKLPLMPQGNAVVYDPPTHVRDRAHWEEELRLQKAPLHIPCFSEKSVSVNVLCLGSKLSGDNASDK